MGKKVKLLYQWYFWVHHRFQIRRYMWQRLWGEFLKWKSKKNKQIFTRFQIIVYGWNRPNILYPHVKFYLNTFKNSKVTIKLVQQLTHKRCRSTSFMTHTWHLSILALHRSTTRKETRFQKMFFSSVLHDQTSVESL